MGWPDADDKREKDTVTQDMEMMADAAWALRISEYDLIRLAFRRWHGREPTEREQESAFHVYLATKPQPAWVRAFCRQVLEAEQAGTLDRRDFGADQMRRRDPGEPYSLRFIALAMIVMLLAYLLITRL